MADSTKIFIFFYKNLRNCPSRLDELIFDLFCRCDKTHGVSPSVERERSIRKKRGTDAYPARMPAAGAKIILALFCEIWEYRNRAQLVILRRLVKEFLKTAKCISRSRRAKIDFFLASVFHF